MGQFTGNKANGFYDGFMNRLYTDLSTLPVDSHAVKLYRDQDRILALTADAVGRDLQDIHGVANHVGGGLLASGAFKHIDSAKTQQ